mmetsp:Transcript_49043/g.56489  ORF Transcript_49043/g.56489 Transcript_49043/m.56489 type:complete len:171 (-) Transcript_49043:244-756(-)
MSELRKNENFEDSSKKSDLCVSCLEFFGNPHTDNLCSKCYRDKTKDLAKKEPQTKIRSDSVSTMLTEEPEHTGSVSTDSKQSLEEVKVEKEEVLPKPEEQVPAKQTDHTRCFQCNKKVGLLGFKCQCESTYCRTHRLPEAHVCNFDFEKAGKERLAKENQMVKADKIQRF